MDLPIYKIKKTIANYPTTKVSEENLFEFEIFMLNDFPKLVKKDDLELFTNGDIDAKVILYDEVFLKKKIGKVEKYNSFPTKKQSH